jgi:hypothetical protein
MRDKKDIPYHSKNKDKIANKICDKIGDHNKNPAIHRVYRRVMWEART